jgi:pimeloyl-ACP methyl ester carboxylesterase
MVQSDPSSEEGWLGLGLALEDTTRRIYCLQRVLTLNPENESARRALESLQAPIPPFTEHTSVELEALPATPEPAPMKPEYTPRTAEPPQETPVAEPAGRAAPHARKRASGTAWFLGIFIFFFLAVIGLIVAYATGILDAYLPAQFRSLVLFQPTSTPIISTPIPGQNPTGETPAPQPTASQVAQISYTPLFEAGACPFEAPGAGEITCGTVTVPENRSRSATDTIRLAVAVYASTGSSPAAEPVIFLQGGPGGGAVELSADAYAILVEPFLDGRTFITFDQRGTGLSEPVLPCDELTQVYSQDLRALIPLEARDLVYLNAFRACHDLLNIKGADLGAYTTAENAADVRDVLLALGYERADVYGVSYGTRLGQVFMRDYPDMVHAAVLDSMLPLEINVYALSSSSAEASLRTLFDACAADETCAGAYPNLEADFWSLVDLLNASPLSVPVVVPYAGGRSYVPVDGSMLLNQVLASLKQTWMIPGVPQSIDQLRGGDTTSLSFTLGFPPVDWEMDISLGMYISVMCHEYIMDSDPLILTAGLSGRYDEGDLGWFPFVGDGEDYLRLCEAWDAVPPAPGEDEPVSNDIPTLVIAGAFDSITPPGFGQMVAAHLPHSYYLEFPDQGHAPTAASNTDCPMTTVLTFLEHPESGPETDCLAQETSPRFLVPYTLSESLPLSNVELPDDDLEVLIPADWKDYGDGIYTRGSSGLDITQLNIFRLDMAPAQALSILSERTFYGRMMLDGEPVLEEERVLGDFSWKLYSTTSFGTPVDMALASDDGTTLMVLLFTHTNEHDALYQAVFLPVVGSVRSVK